MNQIPLSTAAAGPLHPHMRYLEPHRHLGSTFGDDPFGRFAERFARAFGTPKFLAVQTGSGAGVVGPERGGRGPL